MNAEYLAISEQAEILDKQHPDRTCLVTSVNRPGRPGTPGNTCEVTTRNAARLIVEGTHCIATEAEAKAFREAQEGARARSAPAMTLDEARKQFTAIMRQRQRGTDAQ